MDLTPDKKSLIISDSRSEIRLWNIQSGDELQIYKGHKVQRYPVKCKIARDASFFVTGSEDGLCYVYNFLETKPIGNLYGHLDSVVAVDINRKTGAVVTGSFDGNIKIWVP